jgi:hypothetical protein
MLVYFNQDSTLCQWDNKAHMVCNYANQVFASVIFFGAFGTNNMFKLYPVLPWCFLIGALLGLAWVLAEKAMPHSSPSTGMRGSLPRASSAASILQLPYLAPSTGLATTTLPMRHSAFTSRGSSSSTSSVLHRLVGKVCISHVRRSQRRRRDFWPHRHTGLQLWCWETHVLRLVGK